MHPEVKREVKLKYLSKLSQEIKGEPSHFPVEEHIENPAKELDFKVYERRTRRQQNKMLEEEEEKLKIERTENEK